MKKLWNVLMWIGDNINHLIIEPVICLIPGKFGYWVWYNTCQKFCLWVTEFREEDHHG